MSRKQQSFELIKKQGVLPLYYYDDATVCNDVLRALYAAGIRSVEFTNRGDAALKNFGELIKLRDAEMKDLELGIGTIKNVSDAQAFIDAGADYIICPAMIPPVLEAVLQQDMLCVPGCMTSTEILTAEQCGATLSKVFPGNLLGPGFVSAVKELFPKMSFMPTGGVEVDEANIRAWFASGVCAVGMGSKLVSKTMLEQKDYATITALTAKALGIVANIRNK